MGNPFTSMKLANLSEARVSVVRAVYNDEITAELSSGCTKRLRELGCVNITNVDVPGAFELPLAAKWALASGADAAVCLAAVIRGDTAHFDYVCDAVTQGCTALQLETASPVVFGVLTCETYQQALDRIGGSVGHKGIEAADTVAAMLHVRTIL